jgi:hypothetical protein
VKTESVVAQFLSNQLLGRFGTYMKTLALCFSLVLFLIVLVGVLWTVFERRFPFVRQFNDETRHAYILLVVAATAFFAWATLDLHVESVEVAGVKATVRKLQQQVNTLSDQMELFFKSKRIEVFNQDNWDRVRRLSKSGDGVVLEVTLEQEPIPGSVEVYEGVLLMPEQRYSFDGRKVQFPANTDKPVNGLTIKYYPRLIAHQQ